MRARLRPAWVRAGINDRRGDDAAFTPRRRRRRRDRGNEGVDPVDVESQTSEEKRAKMDGVVRGSVRGV